MDYTTQTSVCKRKHTSTKAIFMDSGKAFDKVANQHAKLMNYMYGSSFCMQTQTKIDKFMSPLGISKGIKQGCP